ncbi:MAG: glutaredoxin family protein [Mycobacteriales bacterium]
MSSGIARTVTLLTSEDCLMCQHAKKVLADVGRDHQLDIEEVALDTERGRRLATEHGVLFAPGVLLDGRAFGYGRLSERKLRRALAAV